MEFTAAMVILLIGFGLLCPDSAKQHRRHRATALCDHHVFRDAGLGCPMQNPNCALRRTSLLTSMRQCFAAGNNVFDIDGNLVASTTYSEMRARGAPRNNTIRIERVLVASTTCSNMLVRGAPRTDHLKLHPTIAESEPHLSKTRLRVKFRRCCRQPGGNQVSPGDRNEARQTLRR